MERNRDEKPKILLSPKEHESLYLLKYELKHAESIAEAKFYHKEIHKLIARGKRKAMEKDLKEKDQ